MSLIYFSRPCNVLMKHPSGLAQLRMKNKVLLSRETHSPTSFSSVQSCYCSIDHIIFQTLNHNILNDNNNVILNNINSVYFLFSIKSPMKKEITVIQAIRQLYFEIEGQNVERGGL